MQNEPFDERDDQVDTEEIHTGEEEVADAPREYAFDHIARRVGDGNKVRYAVHWYDYTFTDDSVKPHEHTLNHFTTRHWRSGRKEDIRRH